MRSAAEQRQSIRRTVYLISTPARRNRGTDIMHIPFISHPTTHDRFVPRPTQTPVRKRSEPAARPHVLILSAAVGPATCGRRRQSSWHCEACIRRHSFADVLDLSLPIFRFCYGGLYLEFANNIPSVLRFFYNLMDAPRDCSAPSRWDCVPAFSGTVWPEAVSCVAAFRAVGSHHQHPFLAGRDYCRPQAPW